MLTIPGLNARGFLRHCGLNIPITRIPLPHHVYFLSVVINFGRLGALQFRNARVPAYHFQSSISNRFRSTDISVFMVATFHTDELFAISVLPINMTTISAFFAGMFRIDFNYDFSTAYS